MTATQEPKRCRLVLIAPKLADAGDAARLIGEAAGGGDVASLILPSYGEADAPFQQRAERVAAALQGRDVALVIAGDTRIAGRVHADGIHLETGRQEVADAVERLRGRMIVGAGGAKTRHEALELGEARPDYIFFGRFGYDTQPAPHPRNMALGEWWAEMIEIPCIVMGGSDAASASTVAAIGAEFVALGEAVFGAGDPAANVARINALLDAEAPRFED
jgi:thiamine-phosphate pyrophosphorylase